MKHYDVLVIGGGPAGITLAKKLGKMKSTAIIRPENHSMIYCSMPYVIEKVLPPEKTLKSDSLVTEAGADLIRDIVMSVDFSEKKVICKSSEYRYDKLVVASGAAPIRPAIKGADLEGVMTFKTAENLETIMGKIGDGLDYAIVVGAGAIGIELSLALRSTGAETFLIDREDHALPGMLDRDMSEKVEGEIKNSGVNLVLGREIQEITGEKFPEGAVLSGGEKIVFSKGNGAAPVGKGIVVFAVGMKAQTSFLDGEKIEIGRDGIIVNGKMETSVPDVYAVGDCVQFYSAITGGVFSGKLATNAVPMAKICAENILDRDKRYPGFFNGAATKIKELFAGGTGLTEKCASEKFITVTGRSELTNIFPNIPGARKIYCKIIADFDTGKILGGQIAGGIPVTDKIDVITLAIQHNLDLDDLASLSYSSQPFQSFFPANNLIVAAAADALAKKEKAEDNKIHEAEAV